MERSNGNCVTSCWLPGGSRKRSGRDTAPAAIAYGVMERSNGNCVTVSDQVDKFRSNGAENETQREDAIAISFRGNDIVDDGTASHGQETSANPMMEVPNENVDMEDIMMLLKLSNTSYKASAYLMEKCLYAVIDTRNLLEILNSPVLGLGGEGLRRFQKAVRHRGLRNSCLRLEFHEQK